MRLDTALPSRLRVGAGSALLLTGSCDGPAGKLSLDLAGDGAREFPMRVDARGRFWGLVDLEAAGGEREVEIRATARRRGSEEASPPLAALTIDPATRAAEPVDAPLGESGVAICMATFEPPIELLREQVESIRSQTHGDWVCLVSDDASGPEHVAGMREVIGGDPRFVLSHAARRQGFYLNFERALSLAPLSAPFVALADQDDRWRPEKLERLLDAVPPQGGLVFSDARVTDPRGAVIRDSLWEEADPRGGDLADLIAANWVSGSASLFSSALLETILPFPPPQGNVFHDHWLALACSAATTLRAVEEPLYDYVQHPGAALGHPAVRPRRGTFARPSAARRARTAFGEARQLYFGEYCARAVLCRSLLLRLGDGIDPPQRRALERFLDADRSPRAAARLWGGALRRLFRDDAASGMIRALARGVAWSRASALRGSIPGRVQHPGPDR